MSETIRIPPELDRWHSRHRVKSLNPTYTREFLPVTSIYNKAAINLKEGTFTTPHIKQNDLRALAYIIQPGSSLPGVTPGRLDTPAAISP